MNVAERPRCTVEDAAAIAEREYGLTGRVEELASERDRNFRLVTEDGTSFVLKVSHPDESASVLDLQNCTLRHLAAGGQPEVFPQVREASSDPPRPVVTIDEREHLVRLVTYLEGRPIAEVEPPATLLHDVGVRLGRMDRELATFAHPAMHRFLAWDSKHAFEIIPACAPDIADPERRRLVLRVLDEAGSRLLDTWPHLPLQVIHNDANDHNLLVDDADRVSGIIDFGDMVHGYRVCDLANALAYLVLERDTPVEVARTVTAGYESMNPLITVERVAMPDFLLLRLCLSVSMAACQRKQDPDNAYLAVTETPAWTMLERLAGTEGAALRAAFTNTPPRRSRDELIDARRQTLSVTLTTSYRTPLKIVRGEGQHLFDDAGRRYLDCVNNVCHVGHCHPRVVAAGREQMSLLNTNTRYLHDHIVDYAERLTSLLPDPLSVCFFVNSGSEANDLALRLARTHTAAADLVVIDHSYHGHTQSLIDASPYKHDGRGGGGPPPTTHKTPIPDRYRGAYGYDDPEAGPRYAEGVTTAIEKLTDSGRPLAGFIAESLLGVAGQIELPPGYLAAVYERVRGVGGVCIADEVQVGFGRVGTHRWGFETQDVVPDIVTLGKPIGNGHPLAAVVTTRAVAKSFANGMEYFNTFGGNPVSCAIGLAVLDVIESEGLQTHARDVGVSFLGQLRDLAAKHELIGDVRGRGLFLGVELVRDRASREPATGEAREVIERMKDRGVLLSTDGPHDCVLKIKPPMVFDADDATHVAEQLDDVLRSL